MKLALCMSLPTPMIRLSLLFFWLCLAYNIRTQGTQVVPRDLALITGDIIDLGYARYSGNRSFPNTIAFLGIPYAEPPVGDLRFRSPRPLNTSRISEQFRGHNIDASEYPDFCVQGTTGGGDAGGAGSEDCLKVNIYVPANTNRNSQLPVLVYIHGGGYVYGNPRNWPFDHWVHQSPNIVVVSVYYRLDSFGFLAVPDFNDASIGDFNVGFRDQVQALTWVQQHISAFGGDPTRVTINGESAGGSSVELHLVAHEHSGLFSGAIAQSVYRTPLPEPAQQVPLFEFFSAAAGCSSGTVAQRVTCLRHASVSALSRAQDASGTSAFTGGFKSFHPVLDGKLLTEHPTKSILSGRFARVPLIVGATSNESLSGGTIENGLKAFFPLLTEEDVQEFLDVYPSSTFTSESQREQVITGESQLICAREILGNAFAARTKAWTYRYNQRNPTSSSLAVGHAAENWMMFQGSNTGFNGSVTFTPMAPAEVSFAEELIAYWLSFVRSGDPNKYKLARSPTWPRYTAPRRQRIVLQQDPNNSTAASGSFIEQEPEDEGRRCQFVASKVDRQQN
ncbi:hypothetical protein HGRIS_012357 [Hohenbuehelia grisea]|uniref:Carboxylic ester hydrolase n=1 Tax=Hohenbuehelia grisea TaxID=104357 RepID=A0ABR3IS76_9AGAR